MQIVELAAKAQMPMQIGGFMESRLGMTAAAHLALTNPFILYCDFDTPLMFTEDPVIGGITYSEGFVVDVPEVPGLGAVIDDAYLRKAEKVLL
jgi:L-Ala-D/L-Glu epimerase